MRGPLRRLSGCVSGLALLAVSATAALAQSWAASDAVRQDWPADARETVTAQLNRQSAFNVAADRAFGPALEFETDFTPEAVAPPTVRSAFAATSRRDIWREGPGYSDRLRLTTRGALRRADGAPAPLTPRDQSDFDVDDYDVSYTRGFAAARGYTPSGLEVSLTPHAGVGMGEDGGTAEAGATLRIGSGLEDMVRDGSAAFGQRARWYLYAAGSGRAVGYNFARTRDGDFARSGVTHDSGAFLGDASVGVALRRGDMQGSFGIVYREIKAEGLRGGHGFDREVEEGLVAFQLSIKPEW